MKNPFGKSGAIYKVWKRGNGVRRYLALDKSIETLIAREIDSHTVDTAAELFRQWGDPLDEAGETYLRSCVLEYAGGKGSVLIAGVSALTLAIGAAGHGSESERNIWCFEQDLHWIHVIRQWLEQFQIKGTFLIYAPAVILQNMVRYRIDTRRLPSDFSLVICEGGKGTPRNPLSTLQHFGDHLAASFTLLARRVNIDDEGPMLMQWAKDHGATFVVINKKDGFIKVSRRAVAKQPDSMIESDIHTGQTDPAESDPGQKRLVVAG